MLFIPFEASVPTAVLSVQVLSSSLQFQISFSSPLFFMVAANLLTLRQSLKVLSAYCLAGDGSPSAQGRSVCSPAKGGL